MGAPIALAVAIAFVGCAGHAAVPPTQSAELQKPHKKSFESGGTTLTLTPNFNTGFGPAPEVLINGLDPSPAPGQNARLDGGNIDFGSISPGVDYYYRYAMELGVTSSSSWQLAGSVSGAIAPGIPSNLLLWLTSNSAHYPTSGQDDAALNPEEIFGGSPFGSPAAPATVASGSSGSTTLKYDYILLVPNVLESGASTAQIDYTVVP